MWIKNRMLSIVTWKLRDLVCQSYDSTVYIYQSVSFSKRWVENLRWSYIQPILIDRCIHCLNTDVHVRNVYFMIIFNNHLVSEKHFDFLKIFCFIVYQRFRCIIIIYGFGWITLHKCRMGVPWYRQKNATVAPPGINNIQYFTKLRIIS